MKNLCEIGKKASIFLIGWLWLASYIWGEQISVHPIPRTVLALYDSRAHQGIQNLDIHQLAEMPLNHLGLKLHYHDVKNGLPDLEQYSDVRGILTWFDSPANIVDTDAYVHWIARAVQHGNKFVAFGHHGISFKEGETPNRLANKLWELIGLHDTDQMVSETYSVDVVYADPKMIHFERNYKGEKFPYTIKEIVDERVTSHLVVQVKGQPKTLSHLIITGPHGGYAEENYAIYTPLSETNSNSVRKWYLNPFVFFRIAFDTDRLPKPDTTTLAGRRIYYNQIDGDGWNNITELEKYRNTGTLSSEVVYREILLTHPDLPVTVAPIAADIDLDWVGTKEGQALAEKIFKLPHVEVGCHTFTHPFKWEFFEHYKPEDEVPFLSKYPDGNWESKDTISSFNGTLNDKKGITGTDAKGNRSNGIGEEFHYPLNILDLGYALPRAYALQPFNLQLEIVGAIERIQQFARPDQRVAIYQWSGNCNPFVAAIQLTREAGVRNINGGDTRFDNLNNSYGWVRPLGREVWPQQQIYASNNNENIYTEMWTDKYYAYSQVIETFKRTNSPLRIKPINVYYHIYSAEKLASLNAVLQTLEYVRQQPIIPITTSRLAAIVDGFYATQIIPMGSDRWRIENRGELQTIRFDKAVFRGVDFVKSEGIVGQRHFQGSLYVYLDQAREAPVIALKDIDVYDEEPPENVPYLIESRWRLWNILQEGSSSWRAMAEGFGSGVMRWRVPQDGTLRVVISSSKGSNEWEVVSHEGVLELNFEELALTPVTLYFERAL